MSTDEEPDKPDKPERAVTKGELREKLRRLIALAQSNQNENERDSACRAIGRLIIDHPFLMVQKQKRERHPVYTTVEKIADSFLTQFLTGKR